MIISHARILFPIMPRILWLFLKLLRQQSTSVCLPCLAPAQYHSCTNPTAFGYRICSSFNWHGSAIGWLSVSIRLSVCFYRMVVSQHSVIGFVCIGWLPVSIRSSVSFCIGWLSVSIRLCLFVFYLLVANKHSVVNFVFYRFVVSHHSAISFSHSKKLAMLGVSDNYL